jgi:hypothetical protein
MFYTYIHRRNDTNQVFYVGKGTKKRAYSKGQRNRWWHFVVNKYGYEIEICANWKSEQEAVDHEILLTQCFRDMKHPLVNMTDGGGGITGYRHTEQTKKLIAKASKKQIYTVERRTAISNALRGNKNGLGNSGNTTKGRPKLKGRKPWNYGLTKELDSRVKNPYAKKVYN